DVQEAESGERRAASGEQRAESGKTPETLRKSSVIKSEYFEEESVRAAGHEGQDAAEYFQYNPSPTARYFLLPHFFLPIEGIEQKETRDGMRYRKLAERGLITLTQGAVVDYNHVLEFLLKAWMPRLKKFHEFCYDPYSAEMFRQSLEAAGVPCVKVLQVTREVAPATAELAKLVAAKRIAHGGNEIMRWMIRNVRVEKDRNDNMRLSKRGSHKRIDGPAATITGLARASVADLTPSWYDQPDAKAPTIRIG
ncbi:MAG: terminase TerL endonuclease subunit, partial [Bacteroidota bacterium]